MNKLQKLLEADIPFRILNFSKVGMRKQIEWSLLASTLWKSEEGKADSADEAIEAIWQAAKKHYPDADCFKIEKKSNFEKWKDFFNDLPPFMCDRFCEVLAKKFDQAGFDVGLILECFKEEK